MSFRLTKMALEDLGGIADFTEMKWGTVQRDAYLKQLNNAFYSIGENSNSGMSCDYIRIGYFQYIVGKHVLYYRRFEDDTVQIVCILHGSMDVSRQI